MLSLFRRKLPRSAIMWFAGAALAAVGAVLVVQAHVATLAATRPDVGQPTAVVVAASDLMRGTTLAATSLRVIDLPSAVLPPGAISTPEKGAGRVLGADLAEGEVLTETRLAGAGARADRGARAARTPGVRTAHRPSRRHHPAG